MKTLLLAFIHFFSFSNIEQKDFLFQENSNISIVKTDFKITEKEPIKPKILHFESNVKNKEVEYKDELNNEDNFYRILLKTEIKGKIGNKTIKIPSNGVFNLVVEKGDKFKIIDNDATDGTAVVQVPAENIDSFIRILQPKKNISNSDILLEDDLYYQKEDLKYNPIKIKNEKREDELDENEINSDNGDEKEESRENENKQCFWYHIGKKPVVIPEDWKAPNGTKNILKLTNNRIKNLSLRMYKSKTFEYPNGIAKIGVKGGTVELTGVGKIELPEGALDKDTTIVMRQELDFPEIITINNTLFPESEFISPILKIYPINKNLSKNAKFYLVTDNSKTIGSNKYNLNWVFVSDKEKYSLGFQLFAQLYDLIINSNQPFSAEANKLDEQISNIRESNIVTLFPNEFDASDYNLPLEFNKLGFIFKTRK